jgi:hypothetical protein
MKRKLKWLAIVLAVSLLGFGTASLLWPRDRITAESWHKIRIGMTEEDVAEILGGPGMTYEEEVAEYDRLEKELGQPPYEIQDPRLEEPEGSGILVLDRMRIWKGRRGSITIELDQENHVRWKAFQGVRWVNGGILDRLRDWLGW